MWSKRDFQAEHHIKMETNLFYMAKKAVRKSKETPKSTAN
jgi:hypothetical protein